MANIKNVVLLAAGMLAAVALIVGLVLRHYSGGFIRTVEREAREEEAERDEVPRSVLIVHAQRRVLNLDDL